MKIIKLLYLKYGESFLICMTSSFTVFFIFSLLGNLNEDYLFNKVILMSLLNSLQILSYVPAFIFLISVILFIIILKSKSEIIIIKSYVNYKNLTLFFLPVVLVFTIIEINKKNLADFLENTKTNLTYQDNELISKILIKEADDYKTYSVLENINLDNLNDAEYRIYKIIDKKIQLAQFSNNLIISNNNLIAKNYTEYSKNLIKNIDTQKKININFLDLIQQTSIVKNLSNKNNFKLDIKLINLFIFFVLFFYYVFLVFTDKNYINNKQNLKYPIFICLLYLLYSFFIFNNSLSFYKFEFEFLASVVVFMLVLNICLNE